MRSPAVGPPRHPSIIRVADAPLAAEVQRVFPEVRVVVAPTPELQETVDRMSEGIMANDEGEQPSYFEGGRVPAAAVEALFQAARVLFHVAPWKSAGDSQLLRVDIPAYGVDGACLSIIGALGQSFGYLLFPSFAGFERFVEAAERKRPPGAPIDIGTTTLSLSYERGSDLPGTMYHEALKYGWLVDDPAAYPVVQHRDRDARPRPLTERDIRVVSTCSASLATFFVKHGHLFKRRRLHEPICESYFNNDDIEVRFTLPYEAGDQFEVNSSRRPSESATHRDSSAAMEPPSRAPLAGRNDPCPCGSGKKYKRCCLGAAQHDGNAADTQHTSSEPTTDPDSARASIHNLDGKLVTRMSRFAYLRFGSEWIELATRMFRDPEASEELWGPLAFYQFPVDGKPIVQWFMEKPDRRLSAREMSWCSAQRAAWLSVWEVLDVDPGRRITLKDLLTDETRTVKEASASRSLMKRDAILARVVDHEGISVLCGLYPQSLPPLAAADVVERTRARLRRKAAIPIERMRAEQTARYLIARWEEAIEEVTIRSSLPPRLQNTDGDPLLFTVDHFAFEPADRPEIQRRLASAEGIHDRPEPDDPEQVYIFAKAANTRHRSLENTITGNVTVSGGTLRAETNSIRRADTLRAAIEQALGPLITHRGREHTDPTALTKMPLGNTGVAPGPRSSARSAGPGPAGGQPEIPPEEMNRIFREFKTRSYADWADHPLPALRGLTARAAIRTKQGRRMVDTLLKEMENHESRLPEAQRFDFNIIRRDLGLDE